MKHVIIEGFMGSAKSQVARAVAEKLRMPFIDLDRMVTEKLRMRSREVYERFGEPFYRASESVELGELAEAENSCVILLGSGAVLLPRTVETLRKMGNVYYLQVERENLVSRLAKADKHAWLRSGNLEERVNKMLDEREECYEAAADVTLKTDDMTIAEIVNAIVSHEKPTTA
ncbi:MAG: shikimate kinase [Lachnospiraceae bacterium]